MIDVRDLSLQAGSFRLHDVLLHVAEGELFIHDNKAVIAPDPVNVPDVAGRPGQSQPP